jgi:hypothetical protein
MAAAGTTATSAAAAIAGKHRRFEKSFQKRPAPSGPFFFPMTARIALPNHDSFPSHPLAGERDQGRGGVAARKNLNRRGAEGAESFIARPIIIDSFRTVIPIFMGLAIKDDEGHIDPLSAIISPCAERQRIARLQKNPEKTGENIVFGCNSQSLMIFIL